MTSNTLAARLLIRAQAIEYRADALCNALCAGDLVSAERHRAELEARLRAQPALSDLIAAWTTETDE